MRVVDGQWQTAVESRPTTGWNHNPLSGACPGPCIGEKGSVWNLPGFRGCVTNVVRRTFPVHQFCNSNDGIRSHEKSGHAWRHALGRHEPSVPGRMRRRLVSDNHRGGHHRNLRSANTPQGAGGREQEGRAQASGCSGDLPATFSIPTSGKDMVPSGKTSTVCCSASSFQTDILRISPGLSR